MKPPLPRIASAVPRTLHAQLEIAKAVRTLTAPNGDDPLRQRRAEIAAVRGELEAIKRDLQKAGEECLALVKAELRAARARKYNPDQPRMSAGNRDGGQWTSGGEGVAGSGEASHLSDDNTNDVPGARVRYAQADNNTATDVTSSGNASVTTLEDTQHTLSNEYRAAVTAGHSLLGSLDHAIVGADNALGGFLRKFFDPSYFDINRIGADEVPIDHPRAPVPFVDSDNVQINDAQGNPLLRPQGLPPELYAQAGFAARSTAEGLVDRINAGWPSGRGVDTEAEMMVTPALATKLLAPLAPGGVLDAERFDWTYVRDYRHYQNIMIGVYAAAAGMRVEDALQLVDDYAAAISIFGTKERLDAVYPHSAQQDVEDTKFGYTLYRSGRIRLTK
jgi:hypothetical protein